MLKTIAFVILTGWAACDLSTPAETVNNANELPQIAQWDATITGVDSSPISGSLVVREFGSFHEADLSIEGGEPGGVYQWRIFRATCSVAATTTDQRHSSNQAYPNLVANESGAASMNGREIAGALNSPAGEYSVRLRVALTDANWDGTAPIACGDLQRS